MEKAVNIYRDERYTSAIALLKRHPVQARILLSGAILFVSNFSLSIVSKFGMQVYTERYGSSMPFEGQLIYETMDIRMATEILFGAAVFIGVYTCAIAAIAFVKIVFRHKHANRGSVWSPKHALARVQIALFRRMAASNRLKLKNREREAGSDLRILIRLAATACAVVFGLLLLSDRHLLSFIILGTPLLAAIYCESQRQSRILCCGLGLLTMALLNIASYMSPVRYSRELHAIGLGGGLPIEMQLKSEKDCDKTNQLGGYLLLREKSRVVVYLKNEERVLDIETSRICASKVDIGGVRRLPVRVF